MELKDGASGKLVIDRIVNDPMIFSFPDGSLRLVLPANGSVSVVMVIDRVEDWLGSYLDHSGIGYTGNKN